MLLGATNMILIFALAGTFTATIAGITALVMGQSWWIGLASYAATGLLTVFILGVFAAFAIKATSHRTDLPNLRARLPLADH